MKRILALIPLLTLGSASFAQENAESQPGFLSDPFNHPSLLLHITIAVMAIVILLVVVIGFHLIRVINLLSAQAEQDKAKKAGKAYKPRPSWWSRFSQQMNASVAVEDEKSIELDHSFDGIKELDNHLPPWWTWLFYGTIVWGIVYIVIYHFTNTLPLQIDEYSNEVAMADEASRKLKASKPQEEINEATLTFTADAAIIEKGKSVFTNNNCGSCHRADGGGNTIGPNLTDEYWLHGGKVGEVFTTVKSGVVEKGMPAWGGALSPADVRDVTFYVLSLQGSNPANAKAPQGEKSN